MGARRTVGTPPGVPPVERPRGVRPRGEGPSGSAGRWRKPAALRAGGRRSRHRETCLARPALQRLGLVAPGEHVHVRTRGAVVDVGAAVHRRGPALHDRSAAEQAPHARSPGRDGFTGEPVPSLLTSMIGREAPAMQGLDPRRCGKSPTGRARAGGALDCRTGRFIIAMRPEPEVRAGTPSKTHAPCCIFTKRPRKEASALG